MRRKLYYVLFLLLMVMQGAWAQETTQWTFNYTGDVQTFTAPVTGYYSLECYGAQGGAFMSNRGGYGGTSQLTYQLTQGDVLYVYVGGQGGSIAVERGHTEGGDGGWNGGGKGGTGVSWNNGTDTPYSGGGGGGGATHIATSAIGAITSSTSFTSNHANLLLIAGGGGGGSSKGPGGNAGGATGEVGSHNGTLWSIDWNNGTNSCGENAVLSSWGDSSCEGCGGGGAGYIGGNTWDVQYNENEQCYSGAGGSSWGDTTNGKGYSTTTGGATEGGNGKAKITLLLQGCGTSSAPYFISSVDAWNFLADQVAAGNNYLGEYFRLTANISVTTMIGGSEGHEFSGTFDGDGHKLTVNISDNTTQFVAPFHRVSGGSIKNLYVDGTVSSNQYHMSGLIGRATGTISIENCVVAVNIRMSTSYAGGFVGNVGSRQYGGESFITLTDCLFIGTFTEVDGKRDKAAGFCGWGLSTPAFINCLENGTFNTTGEQEPYLYQGTEGYNPTPSSNSYYKHGSMSLDWATDASAMSNTDLVAGLGSNWVINLINNQPMLKLFANEGKLPGKFTINAGGGQVSFSQGNLQYQASTGTWRFAEHQYDYVGGADTGNVYEGETKCNNSSISGSYTGWIDLFGWGTGNNPTNSSTSNGTYSSFNDWGANAISNGGNTANLWRTLTNDEWGYLINDRTNAANLRTLAIVNGVNGVIIMPDGWTGDLTITSTGYETNTLTLSQWESYEAEGCVFLPGAGHRYGTGLNGPGGYGGYWSSTSINTTNKNYFIFSSTEINPHGGGQKCDGRSVRLVYEIPFLGAGTETDPYLISSEADWYYLANKVAAGNNYSGKFFRQTADISVTTMVGNSESNSFRGTFDGDGHTLTFTKGSSESAFNEESCAPFRHVKNATITNLQVAGTIYTSNMRASGLVATSHGALTLAGCRSSVNINSSKSGDGTHGGLVAITTGSSNNVTIGGCVFDGSFATTSSTNSCGGFVGWTGENTPAITNSLMKPGCVAAGMLNNTFARWQSGYEPTITNCYYVATDNLPTNQGKLARSISADTDVTISNLGAASATYNVSGITAYTHGIKYGSTFYAGNGDEVSLTLSHGDKAGYTFNQYTVTGGGTLDDATSNTPTLTMTDANQIINAEWIKNTATLNQATDNSSFITTNAGLIYDITLTRTLQAGGWNTFCVPFVISSDQITSIFGAGTKVRVLGSSDFDSTTKGLTLNFSEASSIDAGKPYLVYLGSASNVANPTFEGVTIVDGTTTTTTTYADFVPVMKPTSVTADDKTVLFVTGGNTLTYPNADGNINGFRAYFQLKGDAAAAARSFEMGFDGETTGIREVSEIKEANDSWYSLDGRKLDKKPTQKGVYIHNGNKVVIK